MVNFKFLILYYTTKYVSFLCSSAFNIHPLGNRCDSDCQKLIFIIMIWIDTIVESYVLGCSVMSNSLWPHRLQHARFPSQSLSLELVQTHVHWVSDAIQPSRPLLPPSLPSFNLSKHQGLFKWVSSSHQVAKVLKFQLQHWFFQWTLRTDLL